jgi:formylglycine-generating enzyme required for sulfatase activity/FlaG/FlaF family flagellin (archaellin)
MNFKRFNRCLFSSAKAISPVVATALLLVVAVIAVVGFQNWFGSYSSGIFSDVEKQDSLNNFNIENIVGGTFYVKDSAEIVSVKVNGNDCHVSGLTQTGINSLPISNCTKEGENEVVVVTNDGIYSKTLLLNNYKYSDPCPQGYILVPGNSHFETSNFCVMKYEAKAQDIASGNIDTDGCGEADCTTGNWAELNETKAVSVAEGAPWRRISFTDAKTACENLGPNYHLITNREWMTIARNIEQVGANWNTGEVGSGSLKRGNAGDDTIGIAYSSGVYPAERVSDTNTLSLLNLSNNEGIWDFSGNIWEWIDATENDSTVHGKICSVGSGQRSFYDNDGVPECEFQNGYAKTDADNIKFEVGPLGDYNANNGVGRINSRDISGRVFLRGGSWNDGSGTFTGVLALSLYNGPLVSGPSSGFRCVYSP